MRSKVVFGFLTFLASIGVCGAETGPSERTVEYDGIAVTLNSSSGYTISVDGAPFSHASSLALVDPAWTVSYYGYGLDRQRVSDAKVSDLPGGGKRIVTTLQSPRYDVLQGTQTLDLMSERRLRIATDIRITSDVPVVLEDRLGSIAEGWISGRDFSIQFADGRTTQGVAGKWAPSTAPRESVLASNFQEFRVESEGGGVGISTSGTLGMSLVDYRRSEWAHGQKYYWLGVLGQGIRSNASQSYEMTFDFGDWKLADGGSSEPVERKTAVEQNQVVYTPAQAEDIVIPTPKEIRWMEGALRVEKPFRVHVDVEDLKRGTRSFVESEAAEILSRELGAVRWVDKDDAVIRVALGGHIAAPEAWAAAEGYTLDVREDTIFLDAETTQGLAYGLASLRQLFRLPEDDEANVVDVRRAEIFDYPSMPFRGIHFFTGKDGRDIQVRMIERILAPLKINRLVYQVDYLKWESEPRIHHDELGMEKADAAEVARVAEAHGIDVIPLLNTFGHSEWLLGKEEMRYLADNPDDPYAYDPSNPEVYEICERIYREAIEMFRPSIMHIGHDEISLTGFPHKPQNRAVGATELILRDTIHYYEFLKKLGVRTMIWGDMFLGPGEAPDAALAPSIEEAVRRRNRLPADIMIADWHYKSAPVADYSSLKLFTELGMDTVACTWYAPDNIVRFAKSALLHREETTRSLGLLQTTWAGYSFAEKAVRDSTEQFGAYVLAAHAAWTGGADHSADVPFDYMSEFMRRWTGADRGGERVRGWHADLGGVANFVVDEGELQLAEGALDGLKAGEMEMLGYRWGLAGEGDSVAAVRLGGAWDGVADFARSVKLELGDGDAGPGADVLHFALALPVGVPDGVEVGKLAVTLDDGSVHVVELVAGRNVMGITDHRQTLDALLVWESGSVARGEGGAAIHGLSWENPVEGTTVKSVEFKAEGAGPGLLVFGVSGGSGE